MKRKSPSEDRLILELNKQDSIRKPKGINRLKLLDKLARKWVRYGCAETPNEALRMLLGGEK